jgi:hypothetical protein
VNIWILNIWILETYKNWTFWSSIFKRRPLPENRTK